MRILYSTSISHCLSRGKNIAGYMEFVRTHGIFIFTIYTSVLAERVRVCAYGRLHVV